MRKTIWHYKIRKSCRPLAGPPGDRAILHWLAQNLDNPFRGWDGAEHIPAAAAKKAANQYRKTRSQLMKLAAEPGEDAQAQALDAVTAYTQTFNKMGFIETEERDEIYMALRGILDALPGDMLQKDTLIEKFDELRDF